MSVPLLTRLWVESGHAWVVDGPRSLARAAGLPEDAVEATVHAFNEAVSADGDDPLTGRDLTSLGRRDSCRSALLRLLMAQCFDLTSSQICRMLLPSTSD
jgi:hypothetical protein